MKKKGNESDEVKEGVNDTPTLRNTEGRIGNSEPPRARPGGPFDKARRVPQKNADVPQIPTDVKQTSDSDKTKAADGTINLSPEILDEALQVLRDGLSATLKGGKDPDNKMRLESAKLLLAYGVGLPVVRQLRIIGDFTSYSDKLQKLAQTPEGLRVLADLGLTDTEESNSSGSFKKGDDFPPE